MTKKEFYAEVLAEVEHIKKVATPEEIDNLYFGELNPNCIYTCIYGQMTGECRSARAKDMYPKKYYGLPNEELSFSDAKRNLSPGYFFTDLELYITLKGAKNKSLIQYLKGEIKTWKP